MAVRWAGRWVERVTTGRTGRLFLAMLAAPPAGGLAGFLFDAAVVVLLEPETLHDLIGNHGTKPVWFVALTVVLTPAIMSGLLLTHIALAALKLRAIWPYMAIAGLAGLAFTWQLDSVWTDCSPATQPGCPPPPEEMRRIALNNMAMGLVPALGAAIAFWAVLRPDRGTRP